MRQSFCRSAIILLCLLAAPALPAFTSERPPADYTDPVTGMEFMAIPGGTFVMGDNQDESARPAHEVTVKPFLLGRYEVTFDQYAKFCASTGRLIPSDSGWGTVDRPVINVTHQEAVAFTKWLSEKTGKPFRLPSEAEWEFAARGGASSKFPWGDEIGTSNANCIGCGSKWDNKMTAPVGSFAANGYGLYDMIGNVYEWCLDAVHYDYKNAPVDGSAWIADSTNGQHRINRGGSWMRPVREMPITRRCWDGMDEKHNEIGFRVVLEK